MRLKRRIEVPSAAPLRAEPQDEAFDWLRVLINEGGMMDTDMHPYPYRADLSRWNIHYGVNP